VVLALVAIQFVLDGIAIAVAHQPLAVTTAVVAATTAALMALAAAAGFLSPNYRRSVS
jgi:hypothetical protein